jgi:DNA invertase Pin-like site-specific DNA recombinase
VSSGTASKTQMTTTTNQGEITMKPAIAYVRVSTQKQGKSGLGLEAQQAAIAAFAAAEGFTIAETFIEIETGKGADALKTRPQLATALEVARLTKATVIAAKLDRITRDVHFGSGLFMRTDVSFRIADMPHADNFQINIMLSVAQLEREMISTRTKAALGAARERGQRLGSPTTPAILKNRSAAFAEGLRAIVVPLIGMSSRAIAAALNAQGIKTATGSDWSSVTVIRLIDRLGAMA